MPSSFSGALRSGYKDYLSLDESKYRGEWVAIFNGTVIAHGSDPKKVYETAHKIAKTKPFMLTKITSSQYEAL